MERPAVVGAGNVGGKKGTKGRERDALRTARYRRASISEPAVTPRISQTRERASEQRRGERERTERMNERASGRADERASGTIRARYLSRTDMGPRTRSKANIHEMTRRRRGSARVVLSLPPPSPLLAPFPVGRGGNEGGTRRARERRKMAAGGRGRGREE